MAGWARLRSRVALAKSSAVAGQLSRDVEVASVRDPSGGCSAQSRSLVWMERARALPVRGQGFSHLEQQLQRTGQDQPLSGRASGPRRRRRLRCLIVISSCRPIRTWSTTASRPSTCSTRTRRAMRPPRPGWPRCWATGLPGGSCSATPSSYWPGTRIPDLGRVPGAHPEPAHHRRPTGLPPVGDRAGHLRLDGRRPAH
jgi:hypothetical protein